MAIGDSVKNAFGKTIEGGMKAISTAKNNAQIWSDNTKISNLEARKKKYNPLFPDEYNSDGFNLPNVIVIVDDAVRKGIDVCEGAIGWLSCEKGVEVLHLYDEFLNDCGLKFIPAATCDSVYYVDRYSRDTFINTDCYFSYMQEAKLAELQRIAFAVGAKSYLVEMIDTSQSQRAGEGNIKLGFVKSGADVSGSMESAVSTRSQSLATATFIGNRTPVRPELCWFAHDNNVKNLIDMRCSNNEQSALSNYSIELAGTNSASMSISTAESVDTAIKTLGLKSNFSKKSMDEHSHRMIFKLEF